MTLHRYAAEGNLTGLQQELARGVHVDDLDDGWTPLMKAAQSDCTGVDALRLLVEHGADVNAERKSEFEERPLGLAIRGGDLDKVKYLVSVGASVMYRSSSGYDALLDAVYSAQDCGVELVRYLVDQGAPVDGVSKYNETALNVASRAVRMDVVKLLLERGASEQELQWGSLAKAVVFGTFVDVEAALAKGPDLSQRDCWDRTPWMLCLELGDLEKAKLLLRAGVSPDDRSHCGRSAVAVAADVGNSALINWLVDEGFGLEDPDVFHLTPLMRAVAEGHVDAVRTLLRRGVNAHARHGDLIKSSAMSCVKDRAILEILLDAGGDLAEISEEMRQVLRSHGSELPEVTSEAFMAGRSRRFGSSNPELMMVPFWNFMIVSAKHAYFARSRFGSNEDRSEGAKANNEAVWCFSRYGQSITILPNGALVEIGGEHEDSYDADFCIYNDVVVHPGDGTFRIYGYPKAVFPPTDFHTATYWQGSIYIVGSLGYMGQRAYGTTPVYRLNCTTFAMDSLATSGDCPGWIYEHRARLEGDSIVISEGTILTNQETKDVRAGNEDLFALDLATLRWSKKS
jgi:ankyrin repeat protein